MSLYNDGKNKMTKITVYLLIFIVLISILYILNYQNTTIIDENDDQINVEIIISKDFFNDIILSKEITIISGSTPMDALEKVSNVSYNYGGGFVESINGIKSTFSGGSGEKNDWFYYINGMLINKGASDNILRNNDIVRWDYHNWDSNRMCTSIISDFPILFSSRGKNIVDTIIVYSEKYEKEINNLKQTLTSLGINCYSKFFSDITEDEKKYGNLILVDIISNDLISNLNENSETLGWFIEYKKDEIITYNQYDEKTNSYDSGGFITTNQNPWNPKGNWNGENVILIITGITENDVKKSLNVLTNHYDQLANSVNILIYNDKIIKVP